MEAWELRASVSYETYKQLSREAVLFGRSRTRHVGAMVEALAHVSRTLSPLEQARLDDLLREPTALLRALRPLLADDDAAAQARAARRQAAAG